MRTLLTVSATALVVASTASAGFVDVAFVGAGAGQMVKITSPGHNGDVFAGQILLALSNSGGKGLDGNWIAYCADLAQTVTSSTETYQCLPVAMLPMSGPMGAVKAAAIEELYWAAAGNQYTADNDFAAAFQLAIWEIITDYTGGPAALGMMTSGAFQATMTDSSPLSAPISFYLSFLFSAVGSGNTANLVGLGNETYQDQIIEVIPGPGALALGAVGALIAGGRRRRA